MKSFNFRNMFIVLLISCSSVAKAESNDPSDFVIDGIYYNVIDSKLQTVEVSHSKYYSVYSGAITIPEKIVYDDKVYQVIGIGANAFRDCYNLTSLEIPNSVTSIGYEAFRYCIRLTNVTIPNSVTSIGDYAFYDCSGLTSITIPNSVTSIGSCAFDGTAWYDNQPDGPLYINNVFYKYKGTMPDNTNITIKDGALEIAGYAFYDCDGLTGVTIPNSVKNIGKCAFKNCDNLTKIEIPNGVTTIGYNAFGSCMRLASVTIPNSVRSIGDMAFSLCDIIEIYAMSETPATLDYYTFIMTDISFATLYVPVGSKDAYLAADYWKEFGNIVEMDFTAIEDIPADDALHGVNDAYYDLQGRRVGEPAKGCIYIHKGKKVQF